MSKRAGAESAALVKRLRTEDDDPSLQQLAVAAPDAKAGEGALIQTVKRTSGLAAPIMCLRVRRPAPSPLVPITATRADTQRLGCTGTLGRSA